MSWKICWKHNKAKNQRMRNRMVKRFINKTDGMLERQKKDEDNVNPTEICSEMQKNVACVC